MKFLIVIPLVIIGLYFLLGVLLYVRQTSLIFYPGKLDLNFKFKSDYFGEEIFISTDDGERINALFYPGTRDEVILYFHGNAGDLSGWQFVAGDFIQYDYNILIIDYRGYGKSSGTISEKGFYRDAEAAYRFLIDKKGFLPQHIIIYGRSIGSGAAVEVASRNDCRGLVLESPYTSLKKLANQKLPFLFPSLYLKFEFNSFSKINNIRAPIIFIHGDRDTIIPVSHTQQLFEKFQGKKKKVEVKNGAHNDLNSFDAYHTCIATLPDFFSNVD